MSSWNQDEEFAIMLYLDDGFVTDDYDQVFDIDVHNYLYSMMKNIDTDQCELVIEFNSQGYSDPGRTYGDPYYCYPPDSQEDRTLVGGFLRLGLSVCRIPKNMLDKLWEKYYDAIWEVELSYDDSGPEYERDEY